jgi:LysM repeat protein
MNLNNLGNPGHIPEENSEDLDGPQKSKKSQKQFLVIATIAVLIWIIASTLLFKAHERAVKVDINTVNLKLTTLEMGVSRLEGEVKELRQFVSERQAPESHPTQRIDELIRRMDRLEKKINAVTPGPQASTTASEKSTPKSKAEYHEVRRGETLFGISKDYGLSLEQLCHLNQITPETPIHPGQKLQVSTQ